MNKGGTAAGGASEFEAMFEESLRTVKPGGVVKGRVAGVTATHVLIDVGYKSEGKFQFTNSLTAKEMSSQGRR